MMNQLLPKSVIFEALTGAAAIALFLPTIAHAQIKCEANINGFKIHTVYIMGDQYNGVVWAYNHLGEETCLTPTTDLSKADAILEVHRIWTPGSQGDTVPLNVSCTSNRNSTVCSDSTGNELTVDCAGGICTSYYGPSLYSTVSGAFSAWLSTRWYESDANLYTKDHKLLWRSEDQKGSWTDQWPDKLRYGTNSPPCKKPVSGSFDRRKYKNYRNWGTQKCGIEFDPLVSIDLKLLDRQAEEKQKQDSKDEMLRNAQDAATKQKQIQP